MLYRAAITTLSNGASVQLAQGLVHLDRIAQRAQDIPLKSDNCIKPEALALAHLVRLWDLSLPQPVWNRMRQQKLSTNSRQEDYNSIVNVVEMVARMIARIQVVIQVAYNRSLQFYMDFPGDPLPLGKLPGFTGLSVTSMVLKICEEQLRMKGKVLISELHEVKQLATPANRALVNVMSTTVNRTLCT